MRIPSHRQSVLLMGALLIGVWVAGVAVLASWSERDDKDNSKKKEGKTTAAAVSLLGKGEPMSGGVAEPSGIAFHSKLGRLFVVGDEGRLAELEPAGKVARVEAVGGNLEDVAVHAPTGLLLLLSETSGELILYDPTARQEKKRWRLDADALLGERPRQKAQGFEGLTFREDPSAPGGGVLYLVHQREPAMVVSLAFDPAQAAGVLGGDVVRDRWPLKGREDLTGVTYVPSLDRLIVIAEAADRLLILGMDGRVQAEAALPGLQQEGLCFDRTGTLWIADDRGGKLLRFPGALGALTVNLKNLARSTR